MGLGFPVLVDVVLGSRSQLRRGPCKQDELHKGDKAASAQAAVLHCRAQEASRSCS